MEKEEKIPTISLFSGAGGFDLGAVRAGAEMLFANDVRRNQAETYRRNLGGAMRRGRIQEFREELREFRGKARLVIGGPPCQGFSVAGKMNPADPRSLMVREFLGAVSDVRPEAFAMENVAALGELKKWRGTRSFLLSEFRRLGYECGLAVLPADEFGVPQRRRRTFICGFLRPEKAGAVLGVRKLAEPRAKPGRTVREALAGLDPFGRGEEASKTAVKPTRNPVLRRTPWCGMLFDGRGRPLDPDGTAPTITAFGSNSVPLIDSENLADPETPNWFPGYLERIAKDPSLSGRIGIPERVRRLTVRECARLQGFPDSWSFAGGTSSKYEQIGNAVPPGLAEAVVGGIADVLLRGREIPELGPADPANPDSVAESGSLWQ